MHFLITLKRAKKLFGKAVLKETPGILPPLCRRHSSQDARSGGSYDIFGHLEPRPQRRGTMTRKDNFITFLHITVITDLAPQVAGTNRGGPGKITINEIC